MRKFFLLVFIFWSFNSLAQQSSVIGVVTMHNYETNEFEYVPFAQVEEELGQSHATTTDDKGIFKLILIGIAEKESFTFSVTKEGLEVVNFDDLTVVAGQYDTIRISMAKPKQIAEFRKKIYAIGVTKAEKFLKIKLLEANNALIREQEKVKSDEHKLRKLSEEIKYLTEKFLRIQEKARMLAIKYSKINLDNQSSIVQNAFHYFQNGDLDKSLEILNKINYQEQVKKILNIRENTLKRSKEMISALQFKVDIHSLRHEIDSIEYCYKLLIALDSTHYDAFFDYAGFSLSQNKIEQSINMCERCLNIALTEADKAKCQCIMGAIYLKKYDYKKAILIFKKSIETYKHLAKINPKDYQPFIAGSLNNLATIHFANGNYENAKLIYLEALETYEQLIINNEQYVPLTMTIYSNLGVLFASLGDFKSSEEAYINALLFCEKYYKSQPSKYALNIITIYNNYNNLLITQKKYIEAEPLNQKAYEISKDLMLKDSNTFKPLFIISSYQKGQICFESNKNNEAIPFLKETLESLNHFSLKDSNTYLFIKADTYRMLGGIYFEIQSLKDSEVSFYDALKTYQELAKRNPNEFGEGLARAFYNIGNVYLKQKEFVNAENAFNEAHFNYLKFSYFFEAASVQYKLGNLYQEKGDLNKAIFFYKKAISDFRISKYKNRILLNHGIAEVFSILGLLYMKERNYSKANLFYKKAIKKYKWLVKKNKEEFNPILAIFLLNVGINQFLNNQDKLAEKSISKASTILNHYDKVKPSTYKTQFVKSVYMLASIKFLNKKKHKEAYKLFQDVIWQLDRFPEILYSEDLLTLIKSKEDIVSLIGFENAYPILYEGEKLTMDLNKTRDSLSLEKEKESIQKKIVSIWEKLYYETPNNPYVTSRLAIELGNLSWYQLFSRNFKKAEASAYRGLKLDKNQTWINSNLALSLLGQGKFEEAKTIYQEFKNQIYNQDSSWVDIFLQDLTNLEKRGITLPGSEIIRNLLNSHLIQKRG